MSQSPANDRPKSYEKNYLDPAKRQPRDLFSSGSLIEHSRDIAYILAKHVGHFVAGIRWVGRSLSCPPKAGAHAEWEKAGSGAPTDFKKPI
jgi:hypothetical protein